jgi:hypothetical protein
MAFRRFVRLAIRGPGPGVAYFLKKTSAEPFLRGWDPMEQPSWRLIRRTDAACLQRSDGIFIHPVGFGLHLPGGNVYMLGANGLAADFAQNCSQR